LRALQAQIEPHFLFNTLANVTGLIHTQPDQAKQMLEQFIAYLRATLATTREKETTLGADFEMMKTFLSILQIRMGERLKVRFDLPDELRDLLIPPMLLQPLVENAIKHGLEPKINGGEVALLAKMVGGKVAITVADSGLGFQNSTSNGIGLKNVRERVQQIYGDTGSVSIEDNQPCGTRITITFDAK
jgi:sensor histidine kinase YesM